MATKRPALSSILGAGSPLPATETAGPAPIAVRTPAKPPKTRAPATASKRKLAPKEAAKPKSRRAAGHVQLNVLLPASLRKDAKVKALQQDRDLSEVIEELLRGWLGK